MIQEEMTMEKLQISKNGRYFTYPDGTPFVWLADTAWTMPQRMKWDDVTYFMEERKRQGFTVLQIVALESGAGYRDAKSHRRKSAPRRRSSDAE